ncbi:GPCR, rhodopsin-like, 7TM domain and 7TM GPCR, olfactory receptor/chemoreceptor Srsx family-containing protein [Strongyloides ratti]|uniref:GPCR, rhodopsin-like, 7TM domain and 7TM GPCR, olfactory receptor/chemoreceptor Srsx family-containing protein n=1 Tax=Strongyloides ratti TaxID=34506 RepID=A0A090MX36_STRRB|nr:GPCR, rhodopsin-like, 7TM domain and 7TM GPCR, olfactory receptor/chemoreceptor Srsx family-containing protein [Strongyloides ratti]CEF64749.1 GPCR, rhodopsin-like, 7TM domain and 7TM GPCR, olfactory receptor/chemoreceptor Srsx family-containing protein [Strongyloides ratti]
MSVNITIPDGWIINKEDVGKISNLLIYQKINMIVGGIGTIINIFLFTILITAKYFIQNGKLTIFLCIGDLINCLYIFLQGYTRYNIYMIVIEKRINKKQTYWSCALLPFDWLGIIGSLIPHMVTLVIGIERIIALKYPIFYKKYLNDGQLKFSIFCLFYLIISLIIAFILAYINKDIESKYWCGRKRSYTVYYASFIYVQNVIGYVGCFLFTFIIMLHIKITSINKLKVKEKSGKKFSSNDTRQLRNYRRIKQIVIISFISSVTISIPSFVSLASSVLSGLDAAIADPSDWISVGKSSINLFVYMILNKEFQLRFFGDILRIQSYQTTKTNSFITTKILPGEKTKKF